jgi:hypothetical protein
MAKKASLNTLIPLDDLKKVVAALTRVPKDAIEKAATSPIKRTSRPQDKP